MNTQSTIGKVKGYISEELSAVNDVMNSSLTGVDLLVEKISKSHGKVVFIAVGKSGIIAKKLAATFSSTGTTAIFIHATEAVHGDLGMVQSDDVIILISNSGETAEVLAVLPSLAMMDNFLVSFTKNHNSTLARHCNLSIEIPVNSEACHLNLAPTNSSTAALVVGDAIALTLSEMRKFSPKEFGVFHPGGSLGKQAKSM